MMTSKKSGIGSSFESFMDEQGLLQEGTAVAIKRVVAWQLKEAMQQESLSKNRMAAIMGTSRAQLDRILDPNNDRVQLNTLVAAAKAVGRQLKIELE